MEKTVQHGWLFFYHQRALTRLRAKALRLRALAGGLLASILERPELSRQVGPGLRPESRDDWDPYRRFDLPGGPR